VRSFGAIQHPVIHQEGQTDSLPGYHFIIFYDLPLGHAAHGQYPGVATGIPDARRRHNEDKPLQPNLSAKSLCGAETSNRSMLIILPTTSIILVLASGKAG